MNKDNIISKIVRVELKSGTSRSGNQYTQMITHFVNGYRFSTFINDDQKYGIKDALQQKPASDDLLAVDE